MKRFLDYTTQVSLLWLLLMGAVNVAYIISQGSLSFSHTLTGADLLLFFALAILFILTSLILLQSRYSNNLLSKILLPLHPEEKRISACLAGGLRRLSRTMVSRDRELAKKKDNAEEAKRFQSDFLVNMSHELRTPMHAILNFAELGEFKVGKESDENISQCFRRIGDSGRRLLLLLNSLLDLTRLEEKKMAFSFEEANLRTLLKQASEELSSLCDEKSIDIKLVESSSNSIVCCDKGHIYRVIVNLLSNAIKFSPLESTIELFIGHSPSTRPKDRQAALIVSVIDQGEGIEEKNIETIFDKFSQSNSGKNSGTGTGLGLAICREIITAHKGRIWAESSPQCGAKFSFTIPTNIQPTHLNKG